MVYLIINNYIIKLLFFHLSLHTIIDKILFTNQKDRGVYKNMKKLNAILIALAAFSIMNLTSTKANAETIGYVNYKTVEASYNYAKQAYKDIDTKYLELQQYLMDKEKQYKNIESPINKKNFEESVQKDFKAKNDEFTKLKLQKAEEVENNILEATKVVAADKKIDVVLDYRVIFTGGTDLSQDVINYLNSPKFKPAKK